MECKVFFLYAQIKGIPTAKRQALLIVIGLVAGIMISLSIQLIKSTVIGTCVTLGLTVKRTVSD